MIWRESGIVCGSGAHFGPRDASLPNDHNVSLSYLVHNRSGVAVQFLNIHTSHVTHSLTWMLAGIKNSAGTAPATNRPSTSIARARSSTPRGRGYATCRGLPCRLVPCPPNPEEGNPYSLTFLQGSDSFEIQNYYYSHATYEEIFREAGFVSVQWHRPVVSPAGVQQYGQDYWQDFLELAPIIGIECRR